MVAAFVDALNMGMLFVAIISGFALGLFAATFLVAVGLWAIKMIGDLLIWLLSKTLA